MITYNNSIVVQFDTFVSGNAGAGKYITVYIAGTTTKATLFDESEASTPNPTQSDGEGNYSFKIPNGTYDLVIDEGLLSQTSIENETISDYVGEVTTFNVTTLNLIFNDQGDITVGAIIPTSGYSTVGKGEGNWQKTALSGEPVSKTPAQLGGTKFNDHLGDQWVLVGAKCFVESVGVVGDGVTDDTLAYLAAIQFDGSVSSEGLTGVRITSKISFLDGSEIRTHGTKFIVDYTEVSSNAAIETLGVLNADIIEAELTTGNTFNRLINIEGGGASLSSIGAIIATSADQIANSSSKLHGAVQLRSSKLDIGYVRVKNFDYACVTTGVNDIQIKDQYYESYVRGIYTKTVNDFRYTMIKCHGNSANASTSPGHNGSLMEGVSDGTVGTVKVNESGEHGVRIGGDSLEPSKNISFGVIDVYKPGQCAFKIRPADDTLVTNVSVGVLKGTDCATGNAVGTNEDICRLENVVDITIGSINGNLELKANCGNDGIYFNNAQRVTIGDMNFDNPARSMITMEDVSGPVRDITIDGFHLNGSAGTVLLINSPTSDLEHIRIGSGYARDTPADQPVVDITATAITNPIIVNFDVDVSSWADSANVIADDLLVSSIDSNFIKNELIPRANTGKVKLDFEGTLLTFITKGFDRLDANTIVEFVGYADNGVGASSWMLTAVTGQTPSQTPAQLVDWLINDANGNQWSIVNDGTINGQSLGIVGDFVADDTLAYTAALNAVSDTDVTLLLNDLVIGISGQIDIADILSISIDAKNTTVKALAGYAGASTMQKISGSSYQDGSPVTFYNQNTPYTLDFATTLTNNTESDANEFLVADGSNFVVGDLIEFRSQRLWFYDPRNSVYIGELLKISKVVGNLITVEDALAFSYLNADILYTGTADAGTSNTIDLTSVAGIDENQIVGCRIVLTGGTGSGQTRYITSYDSSTSIATIDTVSAYAQDVFSPAPDNTTTLNIDATTYIAIHKPASVSITGDLTIDCNDVVNASSAIIVTCTDAMIVDGLSIESAYHSGIYATISYNPILSNITVNNSSSESDTFGYGTAFQKSRNCVLNGLIAYNCRRASDALGDIPTVYADIYNFNVDGGKYQFDGDQWTSAKPSSGLGDHGQAWKYRYRDGSISNVTNGVLLRGGFPTVEGVRFSGDIGQCVNLLNGEGATVRNNEYILNNAEDLNLTVTSGTRWDVNSFALINERYGKLLIEDNYLYGLRGNPVYINNTGSQPKHRGWTIRGNTGHLIIDSLIAVGVSNNVVQIIRGAVGYQPINSDFSNNYFTAEGDATGVSIANVFSDNTEGFYVKTNNETFICYIPDDGFVKMPVNSVTATDQKLISSFPRNSLLTPRLMSGIIRSEIAAIQFSLDVNGFTGAVAPFTGTSQADGSTYIGLQNNFMWVENRSGGSQSLVMNIQ